MSHNSDEYVQIRVWCPVHLGLYTKLFKKNDVPPWRVYVCRLCKARRNAYKAARARKKRGWL